MRTPEPTSDRSLDRRLTGRGVAVVALCALIVSFLQSPGQISADTKLDLTANPVGFLARAAHLWTPNAPLGQVQNQAYGYFFPHGAFFALGHALAIPAWMVQRLWWAALLAIGFVGIVRLAEALRAGSPGSRVIAATVFVLSPRVLTTLGSISSETLPMVLAPWVLIPLVRALDRADDDAPLWRRALQSAAAVALMGAVNAIATVAALGVAVVWWLCTPKSRRWWRFGMWWALGLVLACAWWIVPLLILSRVSPPFLDFIESSRVTTEWTSLTEVLRGTSSWTPFVSPERVAGAVLVTEPAAVLATGVLAAAGLAGLCMRHMPFRGRLVTVLTVGLLMMCLGYAGGLGSPVAEPIRVFLDGPGAPLRNIHKFEPFIRIPLVLGVAHLLARVPLPGSATIRDTLRGFAHPQRSRPVAAAMVVIVAAIGAGSLMWTGQIAPDGTYRDIPGYWRDTANWLSAHAHPDGDTAPVRSLVVPGAPFADQLWGLTRDEPLQPLADAPWAIRDAIPLTPPGAIRALDSVQRDIADGRGSPGLAATLAQQGIGYVVLRADLDPDTSRSARPLVAQQALDDSPGLVRVARFGPEVGPATVPGVVRDSGLRPDLPAIQIYAVRSSTGFPGTGPVLVDADTAPRVAGGPEALAAVQAQRAWEGQPPLGPAVLDADARRAGLAPAPTIVTDTPTDRETDFGRVDDHSSAIRAAGDPRRTQNAAPDYPVDGQPLVRGQWLLNNQPGQVRVSASGSASDATQLGQTSPANAPAAAFDGDPDTSWVSSGLDSAVGQWLRLDFTEPRSDLALTITTAKAIGPDVTGILVTTDAGSSVVQGVRPGKPVTVTAPSGPTHWVQIRAISTANGLPGNQFAIGELAVSDLATHTPLTIRHRVVLPPLPAGTQVSEWLLTQELSGRSPCVADGSAIRCAPGLGLSPESPGIVTRALSVPAATDVVPTVILRPKPGDGLRSLITVPGQVIADGSTAVDDPRGNASAAVDGDPSTTWTAPENDSGTAHPSAPELVIRLPHPQRVERLRLVAPRRYPAAPTRVTVDLGTGRQTRTVTADGVVDLDPAVTDRIVLRVTRTRDLIDVNSLGFARDAPAGISEVEITPAPPAPPSADRVIDIGCTAGIGITVSGQVVGLSVRTTESALRNGEPVVAHPCSPTPIRLGAGEQELSVNPGSAFTVEQAALEVPGLAAGATTATRPAVTDWSATHRRVQVSAAARQRILAVPESTNTGWRATLAGRDLRPVVVNGWQQGWVVPAGAAGTVVLTYRFDSLYRWSLGVGLALVAVLLVAAWWPRRRRDRGDGESPSAEPAVARRFTAPTPAVAAAGWAVAAWLLTGWWGLLVTAAVAGTVCWMQWIRRKSQTVVVLTFAAMTLATLGLASGPWHAASGYHGFAWWVQLPAFVAVSLTVCSAVVAEPPASSIARRLSRSRSHRRHGSSMNA